MNLLTLKADRAKFPLLLAIGVFVLLALPVPSSIQNRISAIGPTVVWAGSPDETLNPPPPPSKKASPAVLRPVVSRGTTLLDRSLLAVMWKAFWASVRL